MNYVQGRGGGGRLGTCATAGLINLYLFGPEAVPVFPVLKDTSTQYNPLEQIPWNMYGLNIHATSASMEDRFSSHCAALLESTVPQTHKKVDSKFALFIHVHFGIDGQPIQAKLDFCAWFQKNYPSILTDHQQEIDKVISGVVARLLKPDRDTDRKTECYTKAIPNMVKSISYILSHSNNEEFRQQCFSLLSVNNSRVVESEVTNRLWNIASERCGVRGQTKANNHSPIKTNSSKSDSVGCALTNPNHDEASAGTSFTDPEQKSAEGGFSNLGQETSGERSFTDGAKETSIGSSYTDLEHEIFTSYCTGQGQQTFNESSFTDLRNEISAEDGFTEGIRQETITGRAQETYAENFTNSGFTEISQEYSTEGESVKIEHENFTGSGFPFAVPYTHTKASFNTPERESSKGSDFTDQGQETLTRSAYLGLGHDISVGSGFFGLRHETSAGSGVFGLGHETSAGSGFSGLGHETSAGSGFSGLGHETSAGSGFSGIGHESSTPSGFFGLEQGTSAGSSYSGLGHEPSAGSSYSGLGYEPSAGSGFSGLGHETSAGSGFSGIGHKTSTPSGFFGLEQGPSAGSGLMVHTTPLIRTDKNFTQDDRCGFGLSNLAESSRTECCGEFIRRRHIGDHCSQPRHFSSQIHAPSVGTQGRLCGDSMSSIHHGNDDNESQEAGMFHPADTCTGIGPSGDSLNQDGYPLYNSCNTGVSSQQDQHVANTDCFNDLGQHRMTIDNLNFSTGQARDNYSIQGNDLDGQDHNTGAGDSFDDVLENVQQWLDEFQCKNIPK
ncbi:hornerin-like [Mizuhopecten yessoensis]|uniref:hornerin-like n=1 Tax=Mizuhopecten yessoensis TaxID=6573 RepID=UPI000B458E85|nr:hornerin-like [Mizuhopecten yessoensis]